jgi:hypothetical protein
LISYFILNIFGKAFHFYAIIFVFSLTFKGESISLISFEKKRLYADFGYFGAKGCFLTDFFCFFFLLRILKSFFSSSCGNFYFALLGHYFY